MGAIKKIIDNTSELNISDLHFHSGEKTFCRKNGVMHELTQGPVITKEDILEFMDDINLPASKRNELKTKGDCDFGIKLEGSKCVRLNFYNQQQSLSLAVRLLDSSIPDFSTLELPEIMKKVIEKKSGLVLVTGLTGNGKSTTIASLVNEINKTAQKHIITIEDPIEYRYEKSKSLVTQREVYTDCESFDSGLRSALRQDPDIIVIGEIRDKETISVTLEAAESGHLVFSTLHTSSAAASIDRIISYFNDEEQVVVRAKLANVLTGVFTQKLIPTKDETRVVPAVEILFSATSIQASIREGKTFQIPNYIKMNRAMGMITMDDALANLVKNETISLENAFINSNDPEALRLALRNDNPEPKKKLFQ